MKLNSYRSSWTLLIIATLSLAQTPATAATLMTMTFDSTGEIDESVGWNGTTAPNGFLATGLNISSAMKINGNFTAQNTAADIFHVDNWRTTNDMATTFVSMGVSALPSYTFSLGGGSETFSTRLHQHPPSATDMFNSVELRINAISIGSQTYTPGPLAQTLTWNIVSNAALNNIALATFQLYFTGATDPGNNTHGPEWALAHNSFVEFTGTVIPEPSQSILACLGMGLVLIRRRR